VGFWLVTFLLFTCADVVDVVVVASTGGFEPSWLRSSLDCVIVSFFVSHSGLCMSNIKLTSRRRSTNGYNNHWPSAV